jgi:hypothetical protein
MRNRTRRHPLPPPVIDEETFARPSMNGEMPYKLLISLMLLLYHVA